MDPKVIKKTQDTLGKIIKKPPLTEKLLGKPPVRFLHDIVTSVIKSTGFMKGLFTEDELNSENVKERDSKIAFLQKAIDYVAFASGKSISAKPSKIIAGHEPEKTNEFLQCIAFAIDNKVNNEECVSRFLKGDKAEAPKEKSKDKEDRKKRDPEEKKDREKSRDRERDKSREGGREKEKDAEGKSRERRERSKDERHRERDDKHKDRDDRHKDREDRHKEKEEKHREREERHRDRDERHKDRDRKKRRDDDDEKEGMVNGDKAEVDPPRPARPLSAKGARRRRDGGVKASDDEDEDPHLMSRVPPPDQEEGGAQTSNVRRMARPGSARPAPPRRKQENVEQEPAMRLGSGKPTNVIVDDDSDDDDNFMVEESAPPPVEPEQTITKPEDSDEEVHGGLVNKILETKKELEGSKQQVKKTEVERPVMSDAQRRKQREHVQKEIDKLRNSIQTLTRSANPLGKIMDYVQEDLDSMQKELERWKRENQEHSIELKRETGITDKAIEPLKGQLAEVDRAIKDQLDLIAACKANIMRNDQKIEKMLSSISKS